MLLKWCCVTLSLSKALTEAVDRKDSAPARGRPVSMAAADLGRLGWSLANKATKNNPASDTDISRFEWVKLSCNVWLKLKILKVITQDILRLQMDCAAKTYLLVDALKL